MNNKTAPSRYEIDREILFSDRIIQEFYQTREYAPAWIKTKEPIWIKNNVSPWLNPDSPVRISSDLYNWIEPELPSWIKSSILGKNGYVLLEYIRNVSQHGLTPSDYHLILLEKYANKTRLFMAIDTEDMMKLDVLLTDAFLFLGLQMYYGRVNIEQEGKSWEIKRKDPALQFNLKLEEALAVNDIPKALNMLAPRYRSYWMMKKDLAYFLNLQDEFWPELTCDTTINPGQSNQLLPQIRERLIKLRYNLADSTSWEYDKNIAEQLLLFQKDWGLNQDGVLGKGTLVALNTSPHELIDRLKVNMERFRWLPLREPRKYLMVNIANFDLVLIDGLDTLISMRAIVGKESRETPVFDARMTYLVFSPTWTVPPTILKTDVIPELRKGPGYLREKNMKILRYDGSEIAYSQIDWSKVSGNNFPYMVRQDPGPDNALGKVKFMFPNGYNIYIHDTPSRGYFSRDDRAMSSGCIRIEKPFELACILLADNPNWSPEKIRTAMQQNREQTVGLGSPLDVLLLYLTAWTDGNGRVQFRNDIYLRDELVLQALQQKPLPGNIKVIPF
jgi:murein L,D-transpeptidase YcbB/YkuD